MIHLIFIAIVLVVLLGQKNKFVFPAAMCVLGALSALRYNFGSDYQNYLKWYNNIHTPGAALGPDEFLYNLLNYLSPAYQVVIAVTSVVFIYCIWHLIRYNLPERYHWMGLLVFLINPYLYLMNLSAIRQCMAMCLFILAVHFAYKKKFLIYVGLLVLAIFFLKSAILLLPFYFVCNTKPFRRRTVLFVLLGVFALLFVVDLRNIVNTIAVWFRDANYLHYAIDDDQNSLRATLLTSLYFIYVLGNLNKLEGKALVFGKLYLIGTICGVLAFRLSLFTRVQMYFDIFSVVTLPMIFCEVQKRGRAKLYPKNPIATIWGCVNKYVFPPLLLIVYLLRYYSFLQNPLWEAFLQYRTIFSAV